MIEFSCSKCGKRHSVSDAAGGKDAKCSCGYPMSIPLFSMPEIDVREEKTFRPLGIGMIVAASIFLLVLLVFTLKRYNAYKIHVEYIETKNTFTDAEAALGDKDYAKALESFQVVLEKRPNWPATYIYGGVLSVRAKKDKEAEEYFKTALSMDAKPAWKVCAHTNLGYIQLRKEKPDALVARDHFKKAIDVNEEMAKPAALMLSALAVEAGHPEIGKKYLTALGTDAIKIEGASAMRSLLNMKIAFADGDRASFMKHQAKARSAAAPDWFRREAAMMAMKLLLDSKELDLKADKNFIQLAKESLEVCEDPEKKNELIQAFGNLYYDKERYEEAAGFYEKLIDEKAKPSPLMRALATIYATLAEQEKDTKKKNAWYEKTLSLYKRMIADEAFLNKTGSRLLTSTAALCDTLGKEEEGKAVLEQSLQAFPKESSFHLRKGKLLFQNGKFAEGLSEMELSLACAPDQKELAAEIARYRGVPQFDQFRPSKPDELQRRPLIHVRVQSTSPFPLQQDATEMKLDGESVTYARGGNEYFYVPPKNLDFGMHVITVTAKDTVGNTAEGKFNVPVDGTPPLAKLLKPEGVARTPNPVITLSCYDEFTAVDPDSVSVRVKNNPGNPSFCGFSAIRNGLYLQDDEKLGYKRNDPVKDPTKITFRVRSRLQPGTYDVHVSMKDVMGNDGKKVLTFRVGY